MSVLQPVCFMVMPFGKKDVTQARDGAPKQVHFDRLWDLAFMPAIQALGYLPVRADADPGSVIVKDMLNRLKHSDLVLADVSIPNGNVYYEVGIRHVARDARCVLLAADWFLPLFDVGQMRALTYSLPDGGVPEAHARVIRDFLVEKVPAYVASRTPYHELVDERVEKAFADRAEALSAFHVRLGTVRQMRKSPERSAQIAELVREHTNVACAVPEVALELLLLIRDTEDWKAVRAFVESLPKATRAMPTIREQYDLALSKVGDNDRAIADLEDLIAKQGPTPERCGLLGGRYKVRYDAELAARGLDAARSSLNLSIAAYERGFQLDLNEYYCASNLPTLLRARDRKGDRERADAVETLVIAACRRAEERKSDDPWLLDTLFGVLFRRGDVAAAEEIVDRIVSGVPWRLDATLKDADRWLAQAPSDKRAELAALLQRLRAFRATLD